MTTEALRAALRADAQWLRMAASRIGLPADRGTARLCAMADRIEAFVGPPPESPHSWTPDATKSRCTVCGDGPWGRHRFQIDRINMDGTAP